MSGYGRDESAPTPGGLFATHFVGVCGYFTDCLLVFCRMFAMLLAIRQQHYRKPSAAVGADLSCPHIRIHPQNDGRKCVCGETKTRILWNEYAVLVMQRYIFNNVNVWILWNEYVYLVMLGYGRDESVPYALRGVSQPISWVFCVYFVGERCIIATRQQCCCNAFEIHSRNVRNVFVICTLHIRHVKVWFLRQKSMVFGVQKGGFCIARSGFLHCKKWVFALQKYGFCFLNVVLLQFV